MTEVTARIICMKQPAVGSRRDYIVCPPKQSIVIQERGRSRSAGRFRRRDRRSGGVSDESEK